MISEIRLNNGGNNYLINQGVHGVCSTYGSSSSYTIILYRNFSTSSYLHNNTTLEKMIIPVRFTHGINRTNSSATFDIKGYDEDGNIFTYTNGSGYTSDIYELPDYYTGFVSIDPYSTTVNLIKDSLVNNISVTSGTTDLHPPTTPVTLNYWPPFLVSNHIVTNTAESTAAWSKYETTLTCNLSDNYSFDTTSTNVWYYALSIAGYRSGNRYMQPNSLYISNNITKNTCTVFLRFTNMSADDHPVNVNSSVSILWIRQVIDGII